MAVNLLEKVKANLVLQHDEDDTLILGYIAAAVDYAEAYQKTSYSEKPLPPSTEQAVIILASHWFESRDGGTGGFFSNTASAAKNITDTVHRLLAVNKEYWHI
jgi:uncharacterized phage protein (predicted DNA packaging)